MNLSKNTLYDVKWQVLRVSLLGKWNDEKGVDESLEKLSTYLKEGAGPTFSKLWRILNLLNAVRMGYSGVGKFESDLSEKVAKYRNQISMLHVSLKELGAVYDKVTAEDIQNDWKELDEKTQKAIRKNLLMRLKLHSDSKFRDELRWFLDLTKES